MKAIVCKNYGTPADLLLKEVEKPIGRDNEVLIQVHAATITTGDVAMRRLPPLLFLPLGLFGMKRKKIPGHELAGEIEAVGKNVRRSVGPDC